jgi:hypothetical protein
MDDALDLAETGSRFASSDWTAASSSSSSSSSAGDGGLLLLDVANYMDEEEACEFGRNCTTPADFWGDGSLHGGGGGGGGGMCGGSGGVVEAAAAAAAVVAAVGWRWDWMGGRWRSSVVVVVVVV